MLRLTFCCLLLASSTLALPLNDPTEPAATTVVPPAESEAGFGAVLTDNKENATSGSPNVTKTIEEPEEQAPPGFQVTAINITEGDVVEHSHPPPRIDVAEVRFNETGTKYPGFSRDCVNTNDCQFNNKDVKSTVYLNCINSVCACENNRFIADVSIWRLEWTDNICRIAVGGPCGTDDSSNGSITINCQDGLECIEGRCRDPSKLSTTEINHHCFETIDCQPGLQCKVTAFYFGESRTCVTPETPVLKGFEEPEGSLASVTPESASSSTTSSTSAPESPSEAEASSTTSSTSAPESPSEAEASSTTTSPSSSAPIAPSESTSEVSSSTTTSTSAPTEETTTSGSSSSSTTSAE